MLVVTFSGVPKLGGMVICVQDLEVSIASADEFD